jgi:glycosyltransferase involved in cell wall biosynthesis
LPISGCGGYEIQLKRTHNPGISILIPVHNGSRYLRKTLDSILDQTFSDYEVICVNDCSADDSMTILSEFQAADDRIRVLSTETNLGIVPKVVNFAIPHVRGDYFVYASQDDLFSNDWLQSMFERIVITGADAAIPDVVSFNEAKPEENTKISAPGGDKSRILTNREAVMLSLDWSIAGNALYAVRLLRQIRCFDFGMNADEFTTRVFFFYCNKVVFSGGTFYYRQDNPEAITKKLSAGSFDYPYTDFRLFEFLRDHEFPRDAQESVLLRSIDSLSDAKYLLSYFAVKRLIRGRETQPLNFDDAEDRVKRCFDALQRAGIQARLSEMNSRRARLIRLMLTSYSMFHAISLFTHGARHIKSKWKKQGPSAS